MDDGLVDLVDWVGWQVCVCELFVLGCDVVCCQQFVECVFEFGFVIFVCFVVCEVWIGCECWYVECVVQQLEQFVVVGCDDEWVVCCVVDVEWWCDCWLIVVDWFCDFVGCEVMVDEIFYQCELVVEYVDVDF